MEVKKMKNTDPFMAIEKEVGPDERLIWKGRPRSGIMFSSSDIIAIPFSLMWGGFVFFWEYSVLTGDTPLVAKLWGIPFVIVGIYMIIGRFYYDAYRRGRTFYGITDKAVLFSFDSGKHSVRLAVNQIPRLSVSERKNGVGTISLEQHDKKQEPEANWFGQRKSSQSMFENIDNVREVYEIIRKVQRGEG